MLLALWTQRAPVSRQQAWQQHKLCSLFLSFSLFWQSFGSNKLSSRQQAHSQILYPTSSNLSQPHPPSPPPHSRSHSAGFAQIVALTAGGAHTTQDSQPGERASEQKKLLLLALLAAVMRCALASHTHTSCSSQKLA